MTHIFTVLGYFAYMTSSLLTVVVVVQRYLAIASTFRVAQMCSARIYSFSGPRAADSLVYNLYNLDLTKMI